jgi:hypothetical protein
MNYVIHEKRKSGKTEFMKDDPIKAIEAMMERSVEAPVHIDQKDLEMTLHRTSTFGITGKSSLS